MRLSFFFQRLTHRENIHTPALVRKLFWKQCVMAAGGLAHSAVVTGIIVLGFLLNVLTSFVVIQQKGELSILLVEESMVALVMEMLRTGSRSL